MLRQPENALGGFSGCLFLMPKGSLKIKKTHDGLCFVRFLLLTVFSGCLNLWLTAPPTVPLLLRLVPVIAPNARRQIRRIPLPRNRCL